MKTRKNILTLMLVAIIAIGFGCTTDFEEINTNPNSPTLESAAPNMLLTNAIESMTDRVHNIFLGHEMGSCWAQHMAKVQYTDEDRYIPRVSVINAAWTSFYSRSGMDIATIYQIGVDSEHENYQGVALVLQSYILSVLTDLYGDVPMSEAWMAADGMLQPAYDSQADVYSAVLANLATANTLLDEGGSAIDGDILFGGDILAWKKFANSLRLRLILRQSGVVAPGSQMSDILASEPIFESNDDNAALAYLGSAPNNHPINENRKTRDDHRVSATLVDFLYTDAPSPDYRVSVYANLADGSGDYVGLPNGLKSADAGGYLGNGLANTSKIGDYFAQGTTPGMLMSYAELQFILAEAALKGYIAGGAVEAENYYHAGITASYEQFEPDFTPILEDIWAPTFESWGWVPADTSIFDYAMQDFKDWGGTWALDADPTVAAGQIATQRWVATFDQGLQSWIEWRRTGFPVLTAAVDGVLGGEIPRRVYYGSDEYARNKTSVDAANANQGVSGQSDLLTPVWWDVN